MNRLRHGLLFFGIVLISVSVIGLYMAYSRTTPQIYTVHREENVSAASVAETLPEPVDVNTADLETLMSVPGIGEKRAEAILQYRAENGAFADPGELLNIPGFGEKLLRQILPYITCT